MTDTPAITRAQIDFMGAHPANAVLPDTPPDRPWKPWHSPVMVLAGTDGEGNPWLYLAARCGWFLGYDAQHSPSVLASYAATHLENCDVCRPPTPIESALANVRRDLGAGLLTRAEAEQQLVEAGCTQGAAQIHLRNFALRAARDD